MQIRNIDVNDGRAMGEDAKQRILAEIKTIIGPGLLGNGSVRRLKTLQGELKRYEKTGF